MKNVMYLLGVMLCFTSISLSAQIIKLPNQISSATGKGGEIERLYLDENCRFSQLMQIRVSNLDQIVGDPCGLNIAFPTELYPPMFLRSTIMGVERTTPITYFAREECDENLEGGSIYKFLLITDCIDS